MTAASTAHAAPPLEPGDCRKIDRPYAADLADNALLAGPWHTVAPCARIRGHLAEFELDTSFGPLHADGVEMLSIRVEELAAVNALEELSKSAEFADALKAGAEERSRRIERIVLNPVATVKGLPEGVARFVSHSWDTIKDTAQKVADKVGRSTEEGAPYHGAAPPIAPEQAEQQAPWYARGANGAEHLTLEWLGYYKTRRALAERVAVDPYSTNPMLKDRLDTLAWAAFSGEKALGLALGLLGSGAGQALRIGSKVDRAVWQLDPSDLARRNRERLNAYGCPDDEVRAMLERGRFSATLQTRFVDAYVALAPETGCAELLELAAYVRNEIEARYMVNVLNLLVAERDGAGGGHIVLIGTGVALEVGANKHALLLPLPVDRLEWTEETKRFFAAPEFALSDKTVLVSGRVEIDAARGLARQGWSVIEHVRYDGAPPLL